MAAARVGRSRATWVLGIRSRPGPVTLLAGGCLALAALSLLAPSTPTYDPWTWLGWGREVVHLDLSTRGGPAWKPLPVAFTTVFSLAGGAAPALWLVVARAGGLLALALAFTLAHRLAGRRWVGVAAGVVAVGALLGASDFVRTVALGESEGLLIATMLLGVERHLEGRRGQTLALAFAAALIRPEAWPFAAAYCLWLWVREPARRPLVASVAVLVPVLWLGPELWGSGHLLRGAQRAQVVTNPDQPALAEHPALAVFAQARRALIAPLEASALLAVAVAVAAARRAHRRADRVTLALAAAAIAWVAIVAVMAEVGYSGEARYLLPPTGLVAVLAGVGFARVAQGAGAAAARLAGQPARAPAGAVAVCAVLLAAAVPFAVARVHSLENVAAQLSFQARLDRDLDTALDRVGGTAAVRRCGRPATNPYLVPALAWRLHVPIAGIAVSARGAGDVFRTRVDTGRPVLPRVVARGPLRRVGRVGSWTVLSACPRS